MCFDCDRTAVDDERRPRLYVKCAVRRRLPRLSQSLECQLLVVVAHPLFDEAHVPRRSLDIRLHTERLHPRRCRLVDGVIPARV